MAGLNSHRQQNNESAANCPSILLGQITHIQVTNNQQQMIGNMMSQRGQKSLYKASFLGQTPKFKGYDDRNKAYVYNMSNIIVGGNSNSPLKHPIKQHKGIEPKHMNFDTV